MFAGGGALGEEWHHAWARKVTKPNTWKDGIAVAEYLIANRYTSRERVDFVSGSAGGIFVGRAITDRPDLFAAAVPVVGVMDTVPTKTGPQWRGQHSGIQLCGQDREEFPRITAD